MRVFKFFVSLISLCSVIGYGAGCGNQGKTPPTPGQESEIADTINQYVSEQFIKLAAENRQHFVQRIHSRQLLICSRGVLRRQDAEGLPYGLVKIQKYYDLLLVKYTVKNIQSAPAVLQPDGSWQTGVRVDLELQEQYLLNEPGISIESVLPVNWDRISRDEQTTHQIHLYRKLPPPMLDYAELLTRKMSFQTTTLPIIVLMRWDNTAQKWVSAVPFANQEPLPERAFPSPSQAEITLFAQKSGVVLDRNRWRDHLCLSEFKKYDNGFIYVDGKWVNRETHEQTQNLAKAREAFNASASYNRWKALLQALSENPKATTYQETVTSIQGFLGRMIKLAASEDSDAQLEAILRLLDELDVKACLGNAAAQLKETIKQELSRRDQSEKEKLQRQQKRLATIQALIQMLKSKQNGTWDSSEWQLFESDFLRLSPRAVEESANYIFCCGMLQQSSELLRRYQPKSSLGRSTFFIPCPTCDGNGETVCRTCRGSGNCQKCGGEGQIFTKYQLRTAGNRGQDGYYQSCRSTCPSCKQGRNTCSACRGRQGSFNIQKLRIAKQRCSDTLLYRLTQLQTNQNTRQSADDGEIPTKQLFPASDLD